MNLIRVKGIWQCKVGILEHLDLLAGSDIPMRTAIQNAYRQVTGINSRFVFSGWDSELTKIEEDIVKGK